MPTAFATSGVVDQVKRQAAIVADGSGASDEDKIAAYTSIMRSMAQSANTGAGWYQSSTQADRDALNDIMQNASIAKRVQAAADGFNRAGMSAPRDTNVAAKSLDRFNGLSPLDQQLVVAGAALSGGVEDFRSFLEANAQAREAQIAADRAESGGKAGNNAVKVTLSDGARAALGGADPDDAAPTGEGSPAAFNKDLSIASAALRMLEQAADDRAAAAKTRSDKAANRIYAAGDTFDTSI